MGGLSNALQPVSSNTGALATSGPYYGGLQNARDYEMELSAIRSIDEIALDHNRVLAIKRGDLAII